MEIKRQNSNPILLALTTAMMLFILVSGFGGKEALHGMSAVIILLGALALWVESIASSEEAAKAISTLHFRGFGELRPLIKHIVTIVVIGCALNVMLYDGSCYSIVSKLHNKTKPCWDPVQLFASRLLFTAIFYEILFIVWDCSVSYTNKTALFINNRGTELLYSYGLGDPLPLELEKAKKDFLQTIGFGLIFLGTAMDTLDVIRKGIGD